MLEMVETNSKSVGVIAVRRRLPRSGRRIYFVDWNLGNACHYACSYCPKRLHDGSVPGVTLQKALAFCEWAAKGARSHDRDLHIHFSGGEPTIYDEFEPLIEEVSAHDLASMSIVSNGARPGSWWRSVAHLFRAVTLSCHVEYVRMDRFVATAQAIRALTTLHINVPAPPERFDECIKLFDLLVREVQGATVTLKPILKGFSDVLADYSPQQLVTLQSHRGPARRTDLREFDLGVLDVVAPDGTVSTGSASALVAGGMNSFRGWECAAGIESLAVLLGGDIYRSVCKEGGKLGSIEELSLNFPREPLTCAKLWCKCLTDIQISKQSRPGAIWLKQS